MTKHINYNPIKNERKNEKKELKPFIEKDAGISNIVNQLIKIKEQSENPSRNNSQLDIFNHCLNRNLQRRDLNENQEYLINQTSIAKDPLDTSGSRSNRGIVKNHYLNTDRVETTYSYLMKRRKENVTKDYEMLRDGLEEKGRFITFLQFPHIN